MGNLLRSTFSKASTLLRLILILAVAFFVSATFSKTVYACGDSSHVKICTDQHLKDMKVVHQFIKELVDKKKECHAAVKTAPCELVAYFSGNDAKVIAEFKRCAKDAKKAAIEETKKEHCDFIAKFVDDAKDSDKLMLEALNEKAVLNDAVKQYAVLEKEQKDIVDLESKLEETGDAAKAINFSDSCLIMDDTLGKCQGVAALLVKIHDAKEKAQQAYKDCIAKNVKLTVREAASFKVVSEQLAKAKVLSEDVALKAEMTYPQLARDVTTKLMDISAKAVDDEKASLIAMDALTTVGVCGDNQADIIKDFCPSDCNKIAEEFMIAIGASESSGRIEPLPRAEPAPIETKSAELAYAAGAAAAPAEKVVAADMTMANASAIVTAAAEAAAALPKAELPPIDPGKERPPIGGIIDCEKALAALDKLKACPNVAVISKIAYDAKCSVSYDCIDGGACGAAGDTCTPSDATKKVATAGMSQAACTCQGSIAKEASGLVWVCETPLTLPPDLSAPPAIAPQCITEITPPTYVCPDDLAKANEAIAKKTGNLQLVDKTIADVRVAYVAYADTLEAYIAEDKWDNDALNKLLDQAEADLAVHEQWYTCQFGAINDSLKKVQEFVKSCQVAAKDGVKFEPRSGTTFTDLASAKITMFATRADGSDDMSAFLFYSINGVDQAPTGKYVATYQFRASDFMPTNDNLATVKAAACPANKIDAQCGDWIVATYKVAAPATCPYEANFYAALNTSAGPDCVKAKYYLDLAFTSAPACTAVQYAAMEVKYTGAGCEAAK